MGVSKQKPTEHVTFILGIIASIVAGIVLLIVQYYSPFFEKAKEINEPTPLQPVTNLNEKTTSPKDTEPLVSLKTESQRDEALKGIVGKRIFAQAVSQIEDDNETMSSLKKQFEGFPDNLLTARVVGSPELLQKTNAEATIRITLQVVPDLTAYKAFVDRLQPVLEKHSKSKGEFTASFAENPQDLKEKFVYFVPVDRGRLDQIMKRWMPKAFNDNNLAPLNSDCVTITLTTQRSQTADRLECHYYLMDKTLQPLLMALGSRRGTGKLSLLDGKGNTISVDRFPLSEAPSSFYSNTFDAMLVTSAGNSIYSFMLFNTKYEDVYYIKQNTLLFWIAPIFVRPSASEFTFKASLQIQRDIKLSFEEIKTLSNAKFEITFDN